MAARGGHRVLSAASKAKISASLRGNKNAFRGGPKRQRLTSRQKVANINAHMKAKKGVLNDAQLRQRQAVAKRLRARARQEEAGLKPDHARPIPTPKSVVNEDSKVRTNAARAKGSIAKLEARKTAREAEVNAILATIPKEKLERAQRGLNNLTNGIVAKVNTGKGNFSRKEKTHNSNNNAVMRRRVTEINNQKIAKHREEINTLQGMLAGNKNALSLIKRQDDLRKKISDLQSHNADIRAMSRQKHADRSKPSTDPLTKATSKPKPLPGKNSQKATIEEGKAQYARNQTLMPRVQNYAANRGMTESQFGRLANKATGLDAALARKAAKKTAMARNGKGNFNSTQNR